MLFIKEMDLLLVLIGWVSNCDAGKICFIIFGKLWIENTKYILGVFTYINIFYIAYYGGVYYTYVNSQLDCEPIPGYDWNRQESLGSCFRRCKKRFVDFDWVGQFIEGYIIYRKDEKKCKCSKLSAVCWTSPGSKAYRTTSKILSI